MRFLITGLPRMRSAWLAALFSSDAVRCFHDAVHHGGINKMLELIKNCKSPHVGLCDPAAACVYPRLALESFQNDRIIVVRRHEEDCQLGLERWAHAPMSCWDELVENHRWFRDQAGDRFLWVEYEDLDNFGTVSEVFRLCTGLALDKERFDLFNTLQIEQHYAKAASAAALLKH